MKELEFLKMDYDLTKKIYDECSSYVIVKRCFDNVAQISLRYLPRLIYKNDESVKDIEIVYGAMQILKENNEIYARHCFFKKGDKIIDPTHLTFSNIDTEKKYIVAKSFTFNKYLNALEKCDGDTNLYKYTLKPYEELTKVLSKHNMFLIG